jgi:hypothetical protein
VNVALLIDAVVRQTTVLVAQLATSGGLRAPLAHIANQVFLDLSRELEVQGVSRKVSADMFGMALRAYRKKIQRLDESSTQRGRSLWEAVLEHIEQHELCTRADVLLRFKHDDEAQLKSVLHDLVDSGLVFSSGNSTGTIYRCTTSEERQALQRSSSGLEELLWAIVYREGRRSLDELAQVSGRQADDLEAALSRLQAEGRVERSADGRFRAKTFAVPLGAAHGWEGAVFDHYHAVVKTISQRLLGLPASTDMTDIVGGSTFTFKVWPGHPHHDEVRGTLRSLRERLGALRGKVESWNAENDSPRDSEAVTVYAGQCLVEQSTDPVPEDKP